MILQSLRRQGLEAGLESELRTLATAVDLLVRGNLASPRSLLVGDVLVQRFKSVEARVSTGQGFLGKHLELIPRSR